MVPQMQTVMRSHDADTMERVPFTQDYLIIERAGVKTAVIGYVPEYSSTILQEKIRPYYTESTWTLI
ncbi:MAG: hypothetical protein IJV14_05955 [Lachnospiraceae bacterium]|nr:hypothetical protein [Lachnospiraceae bacterium]